MFKIWCCFVFAVFFLSMCCRFLVFVFALYRSAVRELASIYLFTAQLVQLCSSFDWFSFSVVHNEERGW